MASRAPINCSITFKSVPSAGVRFCSRILVELEANDFSKEDVFAAHLAAGEAFLNAVRHGNKMDPTKEIKIDYLVSMDKIEISVMDEGDGFDPEAVPDPRCDENLYKPNGRGLFLIRSYMDEVEFNERGNLIRMVKYKKR